MNISHIDQFVNNGINGQTADGMDIEFSGDVFAMRQHRVDTDEKVVCNFLVRHAANNTTDYFCLLYTSDAADDQINV